MARSQSKAPLSLTHPKLAKEAYGWEADTVTFGSSQRKKWKCSKDHLCKATVAVRAIGGNGCPYCSNRKVLKGFNDLVTTHPEISKEPSGCNPENITFGSEKNLNGFVQWATHMLVHFSIGRRVKDD